jgi:hypothetical protein
VTDLVRKQVVAVIDERTTMVCLHAAGMIAEIGEPFETLAGDFNAPPFHVHCRSIMRPWMSGFLSGTREAANAEMQKRPKSQRRLGPNGEIGSRIPPAYDWNPPTDYTFPGSKDASFYGPRDNSVEFATGKGLERDVTPPDPKVLSWKTFMSRVPKPVLDLLQKRMEEQLFDQDEVDEIWALLLEWVRENIVRTWADLPAAIQRRLGL